jgi:hypothetical protein
VREPDVALFGCEDYDTYERDLLRTSPICHFSANEILRRGVARSAQSAVEHIHSESRHFVLHLDADIISGEEFSASEFTSPGGLRLADVREALEVIIRQKNLLAMELTAYNPDRDADGSAAKMLVELIVSALAARLAALTAPPAVAEQAPAPVAVEAPSVVAASEAPATAEAIAEETPAAAAETVPETDAANLVPDDGTSSS